MINVMGDLYSFSAYYLTYFEKDLDTAFNLKKILIEGCIKLILEIGSIPDEWRYIKHVRLIIENWATSNEVSEEEIKLII